MSEIDRLKSENKILNSKINVLEKLSDLAMEMLNNKKALRKPPYNCPSECGCEFPKCYCSWNLMN